MTVQIIGLHRFLSPSPSPYSRSSTPWEDVPTPTHTLRKKGLNPLISSFTCASMGDIEEEVKKIQQRKFEEEVKLLQRQNSEIITRRRTSSHKERATGECHIEDLIKELPKVREIISHTMPNLVRRATTAPGNICHVKKKSIDDNKSGYGITFCLTGQTYIHVPDSVFTYGGEAEVKLALDAFSEEMVVVTKRLDDMYFGPGTGPTDQLHKLLGERRIIGRCKGSPNLAIPFACTYKELVEKVDGEYIDRRYVYTISKYYSGGDLDCKNFEGAQFYRVAIGLAKGLQRMHHEGLVHRDLKPENMYLDGENPLIADFGSVGALEDINRKSDESIKRFTRITQGTQAYKPPETDKSLYRIDIQKDRNTAANEFYEQPLTDFERRNFMRFAKMGDIFSFGVCLFQLSRPVCDPFQKREFRHLQLVDAVTLFRRSPMPVSGLDALIYRTLNSNLQERPTIDEVVGQLTTLSHLEGVRSTNPENYPSCSSMEQMFFK